MNLKNWTYFKRKFLSPILVLSKHLIWMMIIKIKIYTVMNASLKS